jgi:hypothetical protein
VTPAATPARCQKHQADAIDTCGICQRPLCKDCWRIGPLPKCNDCAAQDNALPGKKASGRPVAVFAIAVILFFFWLCHGCNAHDWMRT